MDGIVKNKELQKDLANQVHDMMLGKLQDIEGLDSIDIFPLAPGWWALIIIISILLLRHFVLRIRKMLFMRTWQYKVLQELDQMQSDLSNSSAKNIIVKISEIIRRLAMYQYSRQQCAGLQGDEWLIWLTEHDNKKFNWVKHGKILIELPYMPENRDNVPLKEISRLINATKNWVI